MTPVERPEDVAQEQESAREELALLLLLLLGRAQRFIARHTQADGTLSPRQTAALIDLLQVGLLRVFVGEGGTVTRGDAPVSPFAVLLFNRIGAVQGKVLQRHADRLKALLPPTVFTWLTAVTVPTRAAPLPNYTPPARWIDPAGTLLSERVWRAALSARMKVDRYITTATSQGVPAAAMSAGLGQLLTPSAAPPTDTRLRGMRVLADVERLLQAEIGRYAAQSVFFAAAGNPLTAGIEWALHPRHPRIDICDNYATLSMGGSRLRPPYPEDAAPQVITDSHVGCLCSNLTAVADDPDVIAALQAQMERGDPAPVTPASPDYLRWVYGAAAVYLMTR